MKVAAVQTLEFEWVPCAAHIINNATKRGLEAIDGDEEQGAAWVMFRLAQQLPTKLKLSNVKQERFFDI